MGLDTLSSPGEPAYFSLSKVDRYILGWPVHPPATHSVLSRRFLLFEMNGTRRKAELCAESFANRRDDQERVTKVSNLPAFGNSGCVLSVILSQPLLHS